MAVCVKCFGSGKNQCPSHSGPKCGTCRGSGVINCTVCGGSGKTPKSSFLGRGSGRFSLYTAF